MRCLLFCSALTIFSALSLSLSLVAAEPAKQSDVKAPQKNRLGEPDIGPVVPARSVLGKSVKTADGRTLGEVADLAMDLEEGFVAMIMVAEEGEGDRGMLPLPIDVLSHDESGLTLSDKVSADALHKTPRLKSRERLEGATRLWAATIYQQFEVEPYWNNRLQSSAWGKASKYGALYDPDSTKTIGGKIQDVTYIAPLPGMAVGTQLTVSDGDAMHQVQLGPLSFLSRRDISFRPGEQVEVTGSQVKINGHRVIMAATIEAGDRKIELRDKQGNVAWEEKRASDDSYAFTSLKSLGDMPITNSEGDDLGKIADFAIARNSGLIAYAAMACSCLPDTADKLYPIPLSALVVKPAAKAWILELPLDVLENTPTFAVDDWPEKVERGWVEYVHVRYGRSPFGGVRSEEKKLR